MALIEIMQETNRDFIKMMADQHKSSTELLVQIANKPPVVVKSGGGCQIF